MKKVCAVVVFLAAAMVLSSCTYNTCPTYAKEPVKNGVRGAKESRI